MSRLERLPIFVDEAVGLEEFRGVYDVVKCVCFRPAREDRTDIQSETTPRKRKRQGEYENLTFSSQSSLSSRHVEVLKLIQDAYESASLRDKKSWNAENEEKEKPISSKSPSIFLSWDTKPRPNKDSKSNSNSEENGYTSEKDSQEFSANMDGYCSFILQDDSENSVSIFRKRLKSLLTKHYGGKSNVSWEKVLPHSMLFNAANTVFDGGKATSGTKEAGKAISSLLTIAPHYWIFVGRNQHSANGKWLSGRREHTDSIEHDGTFHHQLLGGKLWKLRPTTELREICDQQHDMALHDSYEIFVEEGDVFVINTRLWWHQTEISNGWSVSYARDLYLKRSLDAGYNKSIAETKSTEFTEKKFVGNKEVSWASGFIPRGTTLVVDDVVDDDSDSVDNGYDDNDNNDIYSLYDYLVPPTIRRTNLHSEANCKLALLSNDIEDKTENHSPKKIETRKPYRRKQVALEMTRDIQEGEEFVLLKAEDPAKTLNS